MYDVRLGDESAQNLQIQWGSAKAYGGFSCKGDRMLMVCFTWSSKYRFLWYSFLMLRWSNTYTWWQPCDSAFVIWSNACAIYILLVCAKYTFHFDSTLYGGHHHAGRVAGISYRGHLSLRSSRSLWCHWARKIHLVDFHWTVTNFIWMDDIETVEFSFP